MAPQRADLEASDLLVEQAEGKPLMVIFGLLCEALVHHPVLHFEQAHVSVVEDSIYLLQAMGLAQVTSFRTAGTVVEARDFAVLKPTMEGRLFEWTTE